MTDEEIENLDRQISAASAMNAGLAAQQKNPPVQMLSIHPAHAAWLVAEVRNLREALAPIARGDYSYKSPDGACQCARFAEIALTKTT